MNTFIQKTFGGLSKPYYFRQLFFGLLMACGMFIFVVKIFDHEVTTLFIAYLTINTILYPYSRFVFDSVMSFIFGNNVFFFAIDLWLLLKVLAIGFCFTASVFIAPIGLLYLYFYHSKQQ